MQERGRVEDYTGTCLVMGFLNLFCGLFVLWAAVGYPAVLGAGVGGYLLIGRVAEKRR